MQMGARAVSLSRVISADLATLASTENSLTRGHAEALLRSYCRLACTLEADLNAATARVRDLETELHLARIRPPEPRRAS